MSQNQSDMRLPRRAFLKATASASVSLFAIPGWAAGPEAGQTDNDKLVDQVKGGIEKHRKGDGVITVVDNNRKPIADALVRIEQTRHEFLFGCNLFMFRRFQNPGWEADYQSKFSGLFNFATLPFYWSTFEPQWGSPQYEAIDRTLDWCRQQGITPKGHPLVWDHPAGNPRWLPTLVSEVGRLSEARVTEIVTRFKGRLDYWDVVNEAVHLGQANKEQRISKWAQTLGASRYVADHLKLARKANPRATLLVNDYRLDPAYYQLLDGLRQEGQLLFDAVGIQSHMHDRQWPLAEVWSHCETYGKLGRPLHFTEITVLSGPRTGPGENWGPSNTELEAKQADYTAKLYTTLFAHPATQAITWWDFSDRGAWQGAAAGFLRKDLTPKPVYQRLHSLIKNEWWSKTRGQTDVQGLLPLKLFYGTYKLTVDLPGGQTITKNVNWTRNRENRIEVMC